MITYYGDSFEGSNGKLSTTIVKLGKLSGTGIIRNRCARKNLQRRHKVRDTRNLKNTSVLENIRAVHA